VTAHGVSEMTSETTAVDGLLVITAKAVTDDRGTVREFFRADSFDGLSQAGEWQQINMTWTHRGALRGLHGEQMTKLVGVAHGEAFGVYVDARTDSSTVGRVVTVALQPGVSVLVPAGVCNGFQAVSEPGCQYLYCFDAQWQPGMAGTAVNPLDPALGISWPIAVDAANPAQISAKDAAAPLFAQRQELA
jgi:dTDP-4-dehydrorhamnose 3,5-epimerase